VKLTVTKLVKKFPTFYVTKTSLPCSQQPATGLYPVPSRIQTTPLQAIYLRSILITILYAFLISPCVINAPAISFSAILSFTRYFFKIHLNIFLPSTPRFS